MASPPIGSSGSTRLLLSVEHSNGHFEELYVARGLTIGRASSNTIVLSPEADIGRTHARIEIDDAGRVTLRCEETAGRIDVDNAALSAVELRDGTTFRIGSTRFTCSLGQHGGNRNGKSPTACPYCQTLIAGVAAATKLTCPSCHEPLLCVRDVLNGAPIIAPARCGSYLLDRFIAHGGMGLVFAGRDLALSRPVAVKLALPGAAAHDVLRARFLEEIRLLSAVRHPHVVEILAAGDAGQLPYLVMEWVDGKSLRAILDELRDEKLVTQFQFAWQWFIDVAQGLAAIHAQGIIHRDIKPGNILIDRARRAKLADLGVAKEVASPSTALTMTGQLPGTFDYMSPEQRDSPGAVDARSDLYSLGVTFYEVVTGRRPMGVWRPASMLNPSVPPTFDAVLARLLAHQPAERFGSVERMLAACDATKAQPERMVPRSQTAPTEAAAAASNFAIDRKDADPSFAPGPAARENIGDIQLQPDPQSLSDASSEKDNLSVWCQTRYFISTNHDDWRHGVQFEFRDSDRQLCLRAVEQDIGWLSCLVRLAAARCSHTPFEISITSPDYFPMLRVRRRWTFLRSTFHVLDPEGAKVASLRQRVLSFGRPIDFLDENDQPIALIQSRWLSTEYRFLDTAGAELALLSPYGVGEYVLNVREIVPFDAHQCRLLLVAAAVLVLLFED